MGKLNEGQIQRIQTYTKDVSNNEIAKDMGINRKTVAKYRILQPIQEQASDVLNGNEERMRLNKKKEELIPKLSKEEKKKLELLKSYSDKDVKEMLNYIATSTKKEIDKVIGTPGRLRLGLVSDTHFGAKGSAIKELHEFYKQAKDEGVECFVHAGDLVDGCNVYRGQQFEQQDTGFEDQVKRVVEDYPDVGLPTFFISGNHEESYLKGTGADIAKVISSLRSDLENLGYYDAELNINGIKIRLQHGGGSGGTYSQDYKLLRYIDKIPAGSEPDIFALGHYHQAIHSLHRGIHGFMPGAWLKENLLAKRFGFGNVIGGRIIDVDKDENGRLKLTSTFIEK